MTGGTDLGHVSPSIVIEYRNERPVEVVELTASLSAAAEQFRRFSKSHDGLGFESKLYVRALRSGSIIAELAPWLDQIDWVVEHRHDMIHVVSGFVGGWGDVLNTILGLGPKARQLEKSELRAAKAFVAPLAQDHGAQLNIIATDGGTNIINFNFTSDQAELIRVHADHLLGGMPAEERFQGEPLALYQMRDSPPGKTGDMGIIDKFSDRPVKLLWGSDKVKADVLERPENPFDLFFFVTGLAKTAGGQVAAYRIDELVDVSPKTPG